MASITLLAMSPEESWNPQSTECETHFAILGAFARWRSPDQSPDASARAKRSEECHPESPATAE